MRKLVRAVSTIVGGIIDAKLDAWAKHICETKPGNLRAPNSTEGTGLVGYVIPDADTGEPYMTRILFPRVLGFRPMLHHIHRPDYARDLHDHPWAWCVSLILRGSYDEERPADCHHADCMRTEERRVRWLNFITADTWHRITRLHGNVWTLFIAGPRVQGWGFRKWDSGYEAWVKVPHGEYRQQEAIEFASLNIDEATGADLDNLAKLLGVEPRKPCTDQNHAPNGDCVPEPDSDLRARCVDKLANPTR